MKWIAVASCFCLLVVVLGGGLDQKPDDPRPQLSLPCRVTQVYDGDTLTVEMTIRARVRLLDCWAPELRDEGGVASRDAIKPIEGKAATLVVPLDGVDRLDDVLTFGRVLGYVWVDGESLSEKQVSAGHATFRKGR